jgi:ectoine hydroxylase-related dioxygenase (phytanoyl-CoA dioxygenase family)
MNKQELQLKGYTVIQEMFSLAEVEAIITTIDEVGYLAAPSAPVFRRTSDLFAIRRFLQAVPAVQPLLFTQALNSLVREAFGPGYFPVRSIYFDKPPGSNWFVAWHQDLTISVDRKLPLPGFGPWTVKGDQFAVQPPLGILEDMYTIRIHLDDTDETNGALRVLPGSHLCGIGRHHPAASNTASSIPTNSTPLEEACRVASGGIMIMRPLLRHASSRSSTGKRRRVIHIEFSNAELPAGLNWSERLEIVRPH